MSGMLAAAFLSSAPAGATGGPNPPTSAAGVQSEVDCFAGAPANRALPLTVGLSGVTVQRGLNNVASLPPTGVQFGVTGTWTTTFVGPFVEGLLENGLGVDTTDPANPTFSLIASVSGIKIGVNDNATGSNFTLPGIGTKASPVTQAAPMSGLNDPSGFTVSTETSGPFTGLGKVVSAGGVFTPGTHTGDGIYSSTALNLSQTGSVPSLFAQGSAVAAITDTHTMYVNNPPATAGSTNDLTFVGPVVFAKAFNTPNTQYTTAQSSGTTADIGLVQAGMNSVTTTGPQTVGVAIDGILLAGAYSGVPANAPCVLTGYTSGGTAGPGITGTGPGVISFSAPPAVPSFAQYAGGGYGFLQNAGTSPDTGTVVAADGVSIPLTVIAPSPQDQTVTMGIGATGVTGSVSATAGDYPIASYSLVGGSPQTISGRLTVTLTNAATGAFTLSDTGTTAQTVTFQFNACDNEGTPVCSSSPGTVTVKIGTPPVFQPFSQQVVGGQLVLSCNAPSAYVTPAATPPGPSAAPLLQCPAFAFPAITLDGLDQTVTSATGNTAGVPDGTKPGTIYVSDNRGDPTDTWTLTGTFVKTPTSGPGSNPNASCANVVAFCNGNQGAAVLTANGNGAFNGQIAPKYLQVKGIACPADATGGSGTPAYNPPNLNPDATPGADGNFAAPVTLCAVTTPGQSGGTFIFNATYSLTIPESVFKGTYYGTVQYTVA
jgi:hypothetical protein